MVGRATAPTRRVCVAAAATAAVLALGGCVPPFVHHQSPPPAAAQFSPGSDGLGDTLYPKAGNGGYDVANYDLSVRYEPSSGKLAGSEVVTATATQNLSQFDLDLHGLVVGGIKVDDAAATYTRSEDELVITPAQHLPVGRSFTVSIAYSGVPQPYSEPDLGTDGFLARGDGAVAIGEPEVAASWYAVNDHPRDKATYTIRIAAPEGLDVLSNGVRQSVQSAGGYTTSTWVVDAPMASYLATMVVGHYRIAQSTHDGRPVITAVATSLPSSIDAQLARTPEVIDFLSTQFGPYPFDAEGGIVIDEPRVRYALENQTRPIYAEAFFGPRKDSMYVIAHELAHQWYGDSVSISVWQEIWLNEGFATYAEWLWNEHAGSETVTHAFTRTYNSSDKLWPVPPGKPPTKEEVFGGSVYDRGAMVLQALRVKVGDTAFFAILRDWAAQHKGGNGTTAQFMALAEKDSGMSLAPLFNAWLFGTAKPPLP
jgi:aminopeptidase N